MVVNLEVRAHERPVQLTGPISGVQYACEQVGGCHPEQYPRPDRATAMSEILYVTEVKPLEDHRIPRRTVRGPVSTAA